jgi:hypothetical protein
MKKKIIIGVVVAVLAVVAYVMYAGYQASKLSPRGNATYSYQGLDMKVDYGRPYKKGRVIFGSEEDKALLPHGKYWRVGANQATEVTFNKNILFAGKPLNAGTYRMYCIPAASSWKLKLNSELGVMFAANEADHDLDVLEVEVPIETAPSETEQLTIDYSSDSTAASMNIMWDKTLVRVPITIQQ